MRETYWERMHANAAELPVDFDVILVHDPQPAAMLQVLEKALRAGHKDDTVRRGDAVRQARAVLLVAQSFVLSAHTMADEDDRSRGAAVFDDELTQILERYLAR